MLQQQRVLLLLLSLQTALAAPLMMNVRYGPNGHPGVASFDEIRQQARIWSIQDLIAATGWFPIEINVPDTIGSISSGIQSITGNIIQRFPFINRNPVQQYALVPIKTDGNQPTQNILGYNNPFDAASNAFPAYP